MQKVTLKEISEFIRTGKTPPTKDTKYFNGEVQWFTPGDLDKGKFLDKSARTLTDLSFSDKKAAQYPSGTLLVACIGDIGKLGITRQECSSNQQITGIKPKSNVDVSYLYYWFRYNKVVIQNTANNAVVPILNNKTLEQIKIPLAPLAEQQKIAAILDAADNLRQKHQQLVERYTALSQSLFLEMFGDPVTNPMGWEIAQLGSHISRANNGLSRRRKEFENTGEIVLRLQDIRNDHIRIEEPNRIKLDDEEKKRFLVSSGDLLFIRVNGNKEYVGRCAVFNGHTESVYHNDHIIKMSFDHSYMSAFLSFIFNDKSGKQLIKNKIKTSAGQYTISQDGIQNTNIIKPPINLQNLFVERLQLIEAQKQQAQLSLVKSEALFNSLLQRAFTGELTSKMAA